VKTRRRENSRDDLVRVSEQDPSKLFFEVLTKAINATEPPNTAAGLPPVHNSPLKTPYNCDSGALDCTGQGRIIKDVMRHQLGEGDEEKKVHKKVAGRILGPEKSDPETDTVHDEIDPADFIDPEEFGVRRGFSHDR
jgi:hypothetical protein